VGGNEKNTVKQEAEPDQWKRSPHGKCTVGNERPPNQTKKDVLENSEWEVPSIEATCSELKASCFNHPSKGTGGPIEEAQKSGGKWEVITSLEGNPRGAGA